ncbi:hypothetical protein [Azonexus sp.]|uniref:hypothetical protein n=1 Tax=Azonexus sp. TaxID=1872668 RepID=UPI0039E6D0C5
MSNKTEKTMAEAADKLILPTEVKVCATCSYWDGERQVDEEMQLVVVDCQCEGECLVQETARAGLRPAQQAGECLWEKLDPDA